MRVFKVPYDIKREEKIFGGYLSLRQVIYIILAIASFSICAIPLPIVIKILVVTVISIFFLLCAFYKIDELNFDRFFFYALKYMFRKKKYVYERCCKC